MSNEEADIICLRCFVCTWLLNVIEDEVDPEIGVGGRARSAAGCDVDEDEDELDGSLGPEVEDVLSLSLLSTVTPVVSVVVDPFETPMVALGSVSSTNGLWASALMGFSY